MHRTVVYRTVGNGCPVNVNDEIGLDSYLSYTVEDHLEDLAGEGFTLVSVIGSLYRFSDGSLLKLCQAIEPLDLGRLDEYTKGVLLQAMVSHLPQCASEAGLLS